MHRISAFFLAVFLLVPTAHGAFGRSDFKEPTPEELAMTSVPFAPGAPAVILEWIARHDDDASFQSEHLRIKILTAEGKKYGDISLPPFIPRYHQLRDIRARVIQPDGKVVTFDGKIYEKLIVKAGGYKVIEKTFSLPDVQPGSIIEYRYTRTWPLSDLLTNRWLLQREIPILKTQIWVKPYSTGVSSLFSYRGISQEMAPKKVGDHFEVELTNTPAYLDEPFSPPSEELKPRVEFFYIYGSKADINEYWKDIGESREDVIEGFIGNRSGIKKAAEEVIAGAATSEEKLRKLYARAQQIRNLSFEEEKTEQEEKREKLRDNQHIEHVLKEGHGYRREINRLFVGLARAAGFTANIVMIATRDDGFFSQNLPDWNQFKSEVALVNVDGTERYFDPGTPHAPFGLLSWENTIVAGMKIEKKKGGTFVKVPDQPDSVARRVRKADLRLDGDVLKGKVFLSYEGQEALQKRLEMHTHDEATNRKSVEDEAKGWFPDGSTVKLTKLSALTASDDPLVLELDVELANIGTVAGSRALVPLAVFTSTRKNPFTAEQRKADVYFAYQSQTEDEVTFHLPEGYTLESLPQKQDINLGAARYVAEWKRNGDAVTLNRSTYVRTVHIPAANYAAIKSYYTRMATADQESVVLKKVAK